MTTGKTTRNSRLEFARWAMSELPRRIKLAGVFHPAVPKCPAHWLLDDKGCRLLLAGSVLLHPDESTLSQLLDVWVDGGRKVLSISWAPGQPWMPPRVIALRQGDWMRQLGWPGDDESSNCHAPD